MKLIGDPNKTDFAIKDVRHLKNSIIYSLNGLKVSYKEERSLKLHSFVSVLIIILGIIFKITIYDWIICLIFMGIILCFELINTAIESCVDLVTTKRHPLAKKSKDAASAASFVMSILAFIGQLTVFMPHIIKFFGG